MWSAASAASKRMSLFIASFIRGRAASLTSCQTRFYGQLVDFSVAINSSDPLSGPSPLPHSGPRWPWRKPTDVGRRDTRPGPVDIKGSGRLLQKNHCVWVNFLQCIHGEEGRSAPILGEMTTNCLISPGIREHLPLWAAWPHKECLFLLWGYLQLLWGRTWSHVRSDDEMRCLNGQFGSNPWTSFSDK